MTVVACHPTLLPALSDRRGAAIGHFIGGTWLPVIAGQTFDRENPADAREVVATFAMGNAADVDAAVAAAKAAFPAWRDMPAPLRAGYLEAAGLAMSRRAEEIAQALTWEEGKALPESRQEVARAIAFMRYCAAEGRRLGGDTLPSEGGGWNMTKRKPLGVVGLITPWNFPINIPTIKSAPALLAGNTVVLKASHFSPLVATMLAEVYAEAGLPPGVFNLVHGTADAGKALVDHPGVRAISFTGSTAVGRQINQAAAGRFAKCQLEMGGKNPSFILADADLDRAIADVAVGCFSVTGQRCNANSLVCVHEAVFEPFVAGLVAAAAKHVVGPGLDGKTTMGPLIEPGAVKRVQGYLDRARADGAVVRTGGQQLEGEQFAHGYYMAPTIVTGVAPDHALACEELFGPVVTVVPIKSLEEGLAIAARLPYGLASSVYTRDLASAMRYVDASDCGILHVNAPTTLSEVQMPYGGSKESGHGGREMGRWVFDFFTETVAVYVRP